MLSIVILIHIFHITLWTFTLSNQDSNLSSKTVMSYKGEFITSFLTVPCAPADQGNLFVNISPACPLGLSVPYFFYLFHRTFEVFTFLFPH